MVHICTSESLLAGALELKVQCLICGEICIQRIGYIFQKCSNCKMEYDPFDDSPGRIAMKMRERMKLTRRQLGILINYSRHTIKKYEWGFCPKIFYEKVQKLFKERILQK